MKQPLFHDGGAQPAASPDGENPPERWEIEHRMRGQDAQISLYIAAVLVKYVERALVPPVDVLIGAVLFDDEHCRPRF